MPSARGAALLCLLTLAAPAAPIVLRQGSRTVELDPATLAARAEVVISRPALQAAPLDLHATASEAHWRFAQPALEISASLNEEGFRITFRSSQPGSITWPVLGEELNLDAVILPYGEGFYVPIREPKWRAFLQTTGHSDTMEQLSLPMWALRYPNLTVAYILENPFDNRLVWEQPGAELLHHLTHRFQRNQPTREHSVLVRFGGDSPIAAALLFREWYAKHQGLVPYRDKIRALPDAGKLLGAAHVYLWWLNTPVAAQDVADWPGLAKAAGAQKPVGNYQKRAILQALNGRDPAAIEPYLVPPARRAPAAPAALIRRLHDAGFDRLWLGADSELANSLRGHPEAARLAEEYGYLLAPYDSYHSIHSPSEPDTWSTAQFDQELYEKGPIVNDDGSRSRGFKGKGYHLSSLAARPWVTRRVEGMLKDVPFHSWFLDCDAFGELFDNYSPLFPQTKEQDMQARLDRLRWLRDAKHLVVGSEGGQWYAASTIHFAHGMLTPGFGWNDPVLHDPKSPSFLGKYFPPDGPSFFFKPVALPDNYLQLYFDPRYRLPLFEAALHDSVITTHRWDLPSLKFANALRTVELLELLYGVPPLYHLNPDQFDTIVPAIQAHYKFFSPLHKEIALLPLTGFRWLTPDRQVQQTEFGEGAVTIVANFGDSEARAGQDRIPARSILVRRTGKAPSLYPKKLATDGHR